MELPERNNYDENITNSMWALSLERPGNPAEKGKRQLDESLAKKKIPTTVEEYMELEGLEEWPEHMTSEYAIENTAKMVFGDRNDIEDYLRKTASIEKQMAALDAIEERIDSLQSSVKRYADHILTDEKRYSRIKDGVFYSNADKFSQLKKSLTHADSLSLEKTRQEAVVLAGAITEKRNKDVNFVEFPGFRRNEFTDLPGQLETPQVLHRVTQTQGFNVGFAKIWKKIFLSEASIAVAQDLFWWCFLRIFKPNSQMQQDELFDRLSDSFAALFFSINPDTRDKVFKIYPDVLSQAIFIVFYDAFPESHRMFGPLFKEEVIGYSWELTTGTRPAPGSWSLWDVEALQGKFTDSEGKVNGITSNNLDSDKPASDFTALNKVLESLVTYAADTDTGDGQLFITDVTDEAAKTISKDEKPPIQSAFIGEDLKFEKVLFGLDGLSPLIAHFLNMKHLREVKQAGNKVRLTQIVEQQGSGKTFQDVIHEKKALTKANRAQYERLSKEAATEISKIERQTAEVIREMNQLKNNQRRFKQGGQGVKAGKTVLKKDQVPESNYAYMTEIEEVNVERDAESGESDRSLEDETDFVSVVED